MHASTRLVALAAITAAALASNPARSADTFVAALVPAATTTSHAVADTYQAELRSALQIAEHYPTSREARQLRPTGTVTVWIDIGRDGTVLASGIRERSASPLLDDQALRSVRTSRIPTPPAELFGASASRRFVATIEFLDPSVR